MLRVSFQGEPGAFSEEAIINEFGTNVVSVPFQSLREVFGSVSKRKANAAVVPIENSLEGAVNETYDLLLDSKLEVSGEIKLRIQHCLIGRPGSSLVGLRRVLSHPQALAQCRATLEKLGLETQPFYDTAGSVKFIAQSSDNSLAALASIRAAKVYEMKLFKIGVEDLKSNYTRFLILAKEESRGPKSPKSRGKTSLVFSTSHRPGALFEALEPFAKEKINLTKIESRPKRHTPWEYFFYLDFDGSIKEEKVSKAVEALRRRVDFVKVLGSYPKAR